LCVAFAYTHSDSDGNANSDGNAYGYANCNTWRQNYPYTAAASHTGTSAVSFELGAALFGDSRSNSRVPKKPESLVQIPTLPDPEGKQ
jgi:hypothetical protein